MCSCCMEAVPVCTIILYKISAYFKCSCSKLFSVIGCWLHNKAAEYLYGISFICHIKHSCAVAVCASAEWLYTVISLYLKLSSIYKHCSAWLYKISRYNKLMSVKIKCSPWKKQVPLYGFICFQCPARTFSVCKACIAAIINKFSYCHRCWEHYAFLWKILKLKNIKSRFHSGKAYCLLSFSAQYHLMISARCEIITVAVVCFLLLKVTLHFNNSVCKCACIVWIRKKIPVYTDIVLCLIHCETAVSIASVCTAHVEIAADI